MSDKVNYFDLQRLAKFNREFIDIFETIERYIRRFVVFQSDDEPVIITNWIVHTWLIHLFNYTPYLHIYSATKQCGKSLLVGLIRELSNNSFYLINFTESIFRLIDKNPMTLCIDEVDRWDKESKNQIYGIINAGFSRNGGEVYRSVGKGSDQQPKTFKVFCPKVISGIDQSSMPDTIQDRSIPIELVRKLKEEPAERFKHRVELPIMEEIKLMLEPLLSYSAYNYEDENSLFDSVHEDSLCATYEDAIENDRALDIVEPLVIVASMGTDEWLTKTVNACVNLTKRDFDNESNISLEVLRVCYEIKLERMGQKNIHSEDLVKAINEKKDSELAYLNQFGVDQNWLAKKLRTFGIKPSNVRVAGSVKKGYKFNDFVLPAQRFLSENLRTQTEIPTDLAEQESVENQEPQQQEYFL
jgi:hypothetical protein